MAKRKKKNKYGFAKIAVIAILIGAFMLKNQEEIKKRLLSEPAIKKKAVKETATEKVKETEVNPNERNKMSQADTSVNSLILTEKLRLLLSTTTLLRFLTKTRLKQGQVVLSITLSLIVLVELESLMPILARRRCLKRVRSEVLSDALSLQVGNHSSLNLWMGNISTTAVT